MVTDDDLHESVVPHHRRVDASDWANIYVIGDVHGCLTELGQLLEEVGPAPDDLLVFVGDMVTKGPDNSGVIDLYRRRPNMLSVRGNNEQKLLDGKKTEPSLSADDLAVIETMPLVVSWGESMVVHGGVDPTRPLDEQDAKSLLTTRSIPRKNGYAGPFWFEQYTGPPRVFFGHTVLDVPAETPWAVGLDTGCVYGGALTAYDTESGTYTAVPAAETYQQRADKKWVDPVEALEEDD